MDNDTDDPASLFTPIRNSTSSRISEANSEPPSTSPSPDAPARGERVKDTRGFVIELPKLGKANLDKYQPIIVSDGDTDPDSSDGLRIEEIEGEHRSGNKLFLYARHEDGILRRKEDWEFRNIHHDLYADYMKRKKEGNLARFDPSSIRIHPRHRVGIVININKRKDSSSKDVYYVSDSQASEDVDEEADSDEYGRAHVRRRTRASKSQVTKAVRTLPYSPKSSRTKRGRRSSPNSSDDDSEDEPERPNRRSSRVTQKKRYTLNDNSDYDEDASEDSSDYEDVRSDRKLKRVIKRKGPKPAYGRVRNVDELYDSDPETAPLRGHRDECEKCHRPPAHVLLKKLGKKTKKKKKDDDGLSENDEVFFNKLGGWVRCLKCCVSAHWMCLANTQRAEIVKAARSKAQTEYGQADGDPPRFKDLDITETTEFICGACSKGGICMVCQEVVIEPEQRPSEPTSTGGENDSKMHDSAMDEGQKPLALEPSRELLFRCYTCKRLAHYFHLAVDEDDMSLSEVATFYQKKNKWQCGDCASYVFPLEHIIAWRPFPANAVDRYASSPENANYKESLPREYLVKWVGRSFRRVEWVPHMWLVATHWTRLKNFYELGPKLQILDNRADANAALAKGSTKESSLFGIEEASRAVSPETGESENGITGPPRPLADAEARIPPLWKTVDRVLDILLWAPRKALGPTKKKGKRKIGDEEDSEADASPDAREEYDNALDNGEEPSADMTETIDEFEERTGQELGEEHAGRIIWAFMKWDDLSYDQSTWDSPPRPGSNGYPAFDRAFKYFLLSRKVLVKKKSVAEVERFEKRKKWDSELLGVPEDGNYDIGQDNNFKLMDFQINGVNWLCRNWFHHQQCILADEMGLGKTVQIISFLGLLQARMEAFPCLVVVPNSTITNWVREFARWAPHLRVVPFYGEQKSREIIKKYELQHPVVASGTTGAKYHVLITTYEAATSPKDFNAVFKKNPRWEVLVVDEGQRLKSDASLLFRRLNEINTCHRVIMTGTPLNNNIRELFNLMNFLDPNEWNDLEALSKEFEDLDEERVKDLHERLRPYFLRRVKAEVLKLPPKNEVIVPLSMAPLQKEIYKSILSKNVDVLRSLAGESTRLNKAALKVSNLRNMLMQLRKCLQHPYLIADDIEPKGLSNIDAHLKLIDASGKLVFLKMLLPKLKARGHRVLLFSQFVIGLNILEDFLQGEGYKFLRLDGNTKQADRQKDMDEFNKENSDVFIYILSTRAGGVGINLWSADTVIIYDPDFNPHQDLQAIARAHRFGQKKTCLVFKFMVKNSAEEKIVQTGKKKLVLDHLIVQKMDDEEDSGEVQSILTFGAKALFEDSEGSRDITYSEHDVETLIEKIENEDDAEGSAETANNAFAFAKVWSAHKDELEEIPEEVVDAEQGDSWAQTLQKIAAEQGRVEASQEVGRGVRRKARAKVKYFDGGSPDRVKDKGKRKRKSGLSDSSGDEYNVTSSRDASEAPTIDTNVTEVNSNNEGKGGTHEKATKTSTTKFRAFAPHEQYLSSVLNRSKAEYCGLCGSSHGEGACSMTSDSKNLAEYRKVLIYSDEGSFEDRSTAIMAIDEELKKRGDIRLIVDQPLKPLKKQKANRKTTLPINNGSQPSAVLSSNATSKVSRSQPSAGVNGTTTTVARDEQTIRNFWETPRPQPSSSKRDPPPAHDTSSNKKAKLSFCEICKQSTGHLPAQCPVVALGPKSVSKVIARLTNEGGSEETLTALRKIWRQQKRDAAVHTQLMASSSSNTR